MDENVVDVLYDHIIEKYDETEIHDSIDDAICDYVGEGWEEDFESEYDAYCETCNSEAENDVLDEIIRAESNILSIDLEIDDEIELKERLADEWGISLDNY